jgi:hypothetical protein
MRTKFHDNRFRHLRDIKVIISTVSEAVVLELLMEGIYEEWSTEYFVTIVSIFQVFNSLTGCSVNISEGIYL